MLKQILPLSSIIAMRFLGLFLVLPVISVYALSLEGATSTLVGIVVGGYALTQMIFQIPFGIMSDKLGRKGTITTGLLIFAIGSVVCALADNIAILMLGRFLQGAGAIGAVVTATISDLVPEEGRSKAMAIMGGFIAVSFALAMVLGPTIGASFGVNSLFWLTAILPIISIVILYLKVPNPPVIQHHYHKKTSFNLILFNPNLIRMHITNFLQKGLMTFAFMIIPIVLTKKFEWELGDLWKVYMPAMVAGILAMGFASVFAEKKGKFKQVLLLGILFFMVSYLIIGASTTDSLFIVGIVIFFIGFNMHEPIMQSLTTKYAKVHQKGLVLGIFNSFGYFGTFLGGLLGGIYLDSLGIAQIANIVALICLLWLVLIVTLPNPQKIKNLYIKIDIDDSLVFSDLSLKDGVEEWYINDTEKILVIRYHEDKITKEILENFIKDKS
jgi:predicted MFS family arabinose efflux permease